MSTSDVFICPVINRDEGAWVVEAMAAGLPVIGLDLSGLGMHIQDKWGIKLKPESAEEMAKNMVLALESLYSKRGVRSKMARASLKNARENYVWSQLGKKLKRIYGEALLRMRTFAIPEKARNYSSTDSNSFFHHTI